MRLTFSRRHTASGDVFPSADADGDASQVANCLTAEFAHPRSSFELLREVEAVLEGQRPSSSLGGDAFGVEVTPEGVEIEFQIDDRWPRPAHMALEQFVDLARAWYFFVGSEQVTGEWVSGQA
jgi:hypothetical protein